MLTDVARGDPLKERRRAKETRKATQRRGEGKVGRDRKGAVDTRAAQRSVSTSDGVRQVRHALLLPFAPLWLCVAVFLFF